MKMSKYDYLGAHLHLTVNRILKSI